MDSFNISKNKPIILYGAGTNGIVTLKTFESNGYQVAALVDKRAKEINNTDYSVMTSEELFEHKEFRDYVVIITIKNVFCHNEVVQKLVDNDFHNIVYKPYNSLMGVGNVEEDKISTCYDNIIKSAIEQYGIPKTLKLSTFPKKDYAKIREDDNYIYAYVPITNIFTDINFKNNSPWMNVSLLTQFPHINLFSYFDNKEIGNIKDYIDFCVEGAIQSGNTGTTDSWKMNIINNRYDVFLHMENSFNIDMDFFIRSAPEVTYNLTKDVFNLKGGKHRMTYLVSKGFNYLPLKITKSDYKKWIKNDEINNLIASHVVIEHPYFYRNLSNNFNYYINFLKKFILSFSQELYFSDKKLSLNGIHIFIKSNDYFIARFLYKMGATITLYDNKNANINEFFLPQNSINKNKANSYDLIITDDLESINNYSANKIIFITKKNIELNEYTIKTCINEGILDGEVYKTLLYIRKEME